MLTLTRRPGEGVVLRLEDGTFLGLVSVIDGGPRHGLRLGFEFPDGIQINRTEVDERIQNQLRERKDGK